MDRLADLIEKARARQAAMTPEQRAEEAEAQRRSYCRAEAAFGSDADEAEFAAAIRSGDAGRIAEAKRKEAARLVAFDAVWTDKGRSK